LTFRVADVTALTCLGISQLGVTTSHAPLGIGGLAIHEDATGLTSFAEGPLHDAVAAFQLALVTAVTGDVVRVVALLALGGLHEAISAVFRNQLARGGAAFSWRITLLAALQDTVAAAVNGAMVVALITVHAVAVVTFFVALNLPVTAKCEATPNTCLRSAVTLF
jgi:hypothetical protein